MNPAVTHFVALSIIFVCSLAGAQTAATDHLRRLAQQEGAPVLEIFSQHGWESTFGLSGSWSTGLESKSLILAQGPNGYLIAHDVEKTVLLKLVIRKDALSGPATERARYAGTGWWRSSLNKERRTARADKNEIQALIEQAFESASASLPEPFAELVRKAPKRTAWSDYRYEITQGKSGFGEGAGVSGGGSYETYFRTVKMPSRTANYWALEGVVDLKEIPVDVDRMTTRELELIIGAFSKQLGTNLACKAKM